VLDEQLRNSLVAAPRCYLQRPIVRSVHICAVLQEERRNIDPTTP
jgi:hypothetical protein